MLRERQLVLHALHLVLIQHLLGVEGNALDTRFSFVCFVYFPPAVGQ